MGGFDLPFRGNFAEAPALAVQKGKALPRRNAQFPRVTGNGRLHRGLDVLVTAQGQQAAAGDGQRGGVNGVVAGEGTGRSKKEAEQMAARQALEALQQ